MQKDTLWFNILGYSFIATAALICVIPFLIVISGSFTSEEMIIRQGYSLIPRDFSLEAYRVLFLAPEKIIRAYGVTIFVTLLGTVASLFFTAMTAYVLYRKDFHYRNAAAFFFYFTTLFNGGMIPTYIVMVRYLHLKDNLLALILPSLISVFFMLILRSFMTGSIPDSLVESAKIDGSGDFHIFVTIILPLMTPALASVGLFIALHYWNDWFSAMLYMQKDTLFPLQYLLYKMISSVQFASAVTAGGSGIPTTDMPQQSMKLAMTVVATGPIILAYPFVQRFFIAGITIGAVKG
ncbi:carbohydrate ABC transporter permease [Paenibacillus koleovorans]|uniref:carbohydrate ABC transporter permease n=1 Tax=Paenibacillus koleovorans TaxID=121608 RepID=UPI000FD8A7F7|nr:carbohydrate ABC transporter permease [Paenibacillus koleovorans]